MSRCLSMTTYQRLGAISLMLLCIGGCRSTGSTPSAADPQAAGSTEVGGPPGDEIQRMLIAGLRKPIADHCHKNKQAMIDSVKDLRFVPNKRVLMKGLNGGIYFEIDGTLYWPYRSKAEGHDPSAGEPFGVSMTNDPRINQDDREAKWEFTGFGPWERLIGIWINGDCEEL